MAISVIATDAEPTFAEDTRTLGPFTVLAGDALVVLSEIYREGSTGGTVVSDNVNGTWATSPATYRIFEGGGDSYDIMVWALPVSAAGTITITLNPAGSVFYGTPCAVQARADSGVFEQVSGTSGAITSSPVIASATVGSANHIIFGAATIEASTVSSMNISSPGVEVINVAEDEFAAVHGYRIESESPTPDLEWVFSASGLGDSGYAAVILREAADGGGANRRRRFLMAA